VVVLAGGLLVAPRTMLRELNLGDVGDGGMTTMASVIDQGRMGQIREIELSYIIYNMTDKGLIAFAQAIDARGLRKVKEVDIHIWETVTYTALGFGALTLAFVNGCPEIGKMNLKCPDRGQSSGLLNTMIQGMLRAAERAAKPGCVR